MAKPVQCCKLKYINNLNFKKKCTSEIQGNLYSFIKGLTESEGVKLWIRRVDFSVTDRYSIAQGVIAPKSALFKGQIFIYV